MSSHLFDSEYWREIDNEVLAAIRECPVPLKSTDAIVLVVRSRRPDWDVPTRDLKLGVLRHLDSGTLMVGDEWRFFIPEKPSTDFQYLGG